MKFTENNQGGKTTINFDYYDAETGGGGSTVFHNAYNNCKLGVIEYCDGIFGKDQTKWKDRLNAVLTRLGIAVSLNTHRKDVADFLRANYELYSCAEVPIGYPQFGGIQYHIIIRNTLTRAGNTAYQRPVLKQEPTPIDANRVAVIEQFLKRKRRKADIATELVALLNP